MSADFDLFVGIDWSGARDRYQTGLAVAACEPGTKAPFILSPEMGRTWSREGIVKHLNALAEDRTILCGFDFSFAPPFLDQMAYFPGSPISADNAQSLWEEIEKHTGHAPDLYAGDLVRTAPFNDLFQYNDFKGMSYDPRLRRTEKACRAQELGRAESFFNLVGKSQVGVGSLSGMRALLRLENFTIWPFIQPQNEQSVIVEIYTRIFLTMGKAGNPKVKDIAVLNEVLKNLNSEPVRDKITVDDHICDALASAAGLRLLSKDPRAWNPPGLGEDVRQTEGWTFGVY